MQHTINKIAEIMQKDMPYEKAGKELAKSLASDEATYHDAHCTLHHLKDVIKYAEECISEAAFKELAKDGKRMNLTYM